jgi:Zn-dependent M28 family amino/carboxypeptidase
MKSFRWLAASALALTAIPAISQKSVTISPQRLSQHVQVLGSDAYEGRGPATRGETKTLSYLIRQFSAAGLQPGGDIVNGKRQWTQAVPLLRSEFTAPPQITLNVAGKAETLIQGEQIAVRAPLNGEKAMTIDGAELVFVGYGVKAPERNWDDFKGMDLRGKVLVMLVNDPDFEGGEGDFGGRAMTYYGRWTYKFEEGARQGAKGVLVIHETEPASYGWATVKNSNTIANFDIVRRNPAAEHPLLEGWIQRDLAAQLFAASGTSFEAMKAAAKRRDFRPVPLKATLDIHGNSSTQVVTSHNVLGTVRGSKYPDETVIYMGHWDHLGIGPPDATGDRIYNGAIDNGTGIAQLIEQGRSFAKGPRPQRSVLFMAVTAEEKGLLGSEYYAANPIYPAGKTVGAINTDVLGVLGPARDFSVRGNQKFGLLDILVEEGARRGRRFTPDPNAATGTFYRSDHFTFAKAGIPALSFTPGTDLMNGGIARADAWERMYRDKMYHQPADEFSPDWDFTGIAQDAALLHAVGWRLANSREWPNWSEDSEFRAKRDESAAARGETAPARKGERGQ